MNAETWDQVKDLLGTLLEIEPGRRNDFLTQANVSSEISGEVRSLLAFEDAAERLMDVPAISLAPSFSDDELTNGSIGQQIGVYKIVSELGYGGMGAVYLAERVDGKFSQRVALKLLKRELNNASLRQRFEQERQILASLEHPNIARLLDAGTTDDGVPYFAMEYVEGLPLDKFCLERELDLTERLKLFNKVCDAVAFAHQNLIVHRDLKPSNIIVTGDGIPKLLDFGISKLLSFSEADAVAFTKLGAMTPEYASPEQIQGGPVSTATDVYSLGIILFKLLTGRYPYDVHNKKNGDALREITDTEPTLPSRAASLSDSPPIGGEQLVGDLDNVILKALRKEPEQRYRTVEQFTSDIWRYIDGLPVLARPATFAYRSSKFYHRNKLAVAAGCLILISILGGTAIAVWQAQAARSQAIIASDARMAAETESANARSEQAKSERISKFMAKVLAYANPAWYADGSRFGGNARVIDAMEDLGEKIDTEFAGLTDIQAELHSKFSEVYWMAAKPWYEKDAARGALMRQKSRVHGIKAFEFRRKYYGDYHELIAKDLFGMYTVLQDQVEESERVPILAGAIQMMRETNPKNLNLPYMIEAYGAQLILPTYGTNFEIYQNSAITNPGENRYQIAERLYLEALPVFRFHYKPDNSAIYSAECRLSYSLMMQEKWADFDEHYAICRQWDPKTPDLAKKTSEKADIVLIESNELFKKRYPGL